MRLAILKQIIPLSIVCAVLVGYQYMGATWTEPAAGTLAATNVPAPINIGTESQIKEGRLSVDALTVFGDALTTGTTTSDRVFAREYCDANGENCGGAGGGGGGAWGEWQDLTGSRSSGATYQNTTGGPLMVAVTYHAFDNNNAPSYQFQVSTDGSNWIKIGQQGERWTNHSWFVPVPAGQYYRITGHNGVLSWAELAMGSAGSGSLPNCPANTTLKSDGSGGYNCATTVVCSLFHNTETCIDLSTNTCFYTNDGVWDDARRSIENHYSITTSEYQIVGGGQGAGVHSSVHEKCTTGIPNGWWQTFEVIL